MTATTVPASPARRPPPWRDVRVLRFAAQVAVVAAVVGLLGYLYDNLVTNLRIRGIPTDFDFLDRPATIEVAYSDFRASQPVRDAIVLGIKNTLLVAAIGIVLTIVLGTIVGVARLSTNLLVRSAAGLYVETLRNLPPLLVIVFVNSAVFLELPVIADAIDIGGLLVLSNRELAAASLGLRRRRRRLRVGPRGRRRWWPAPCGSSGRRSASPPVRPTTGCCGPPPRCSPAPSAATSCSMPR